MNIYLITSVRDFFIEHGTIGYSLLILPIDITVDRVILGVETTLTPRRGVTGKMWGAQSLGGIGD